MASERVQRQIDRLLDEAEAALAQRDWATVKTLAEDALALDPENADARGLLSGAERRLGSDTPSQAAATTTASGQPTSFANGRYVVSKFLGEGGKKKVYLAKDTRLDRDVAFALIKTEGLDEASRVRVQREAEAMGRLGAHPHIVTVFDIGDEDGQPYLVLPVLAGGDVEALIEKAPDNKLTIERVVKIATDTCLGLEFAHSKGIVHRDLKPGNVWLTEDGRAMIGDFGLAVAVDRSRLTQAGMMVGTLSYMPPEQAMGGEVGPRSDLYSLGAMLYEMVCGRPPFVGDESVAIIGQHLNTPPVAPSWHRPDCPPALESLILRLLEKDPQKRPSSASDVREALESVTRTRPEALEGRGGESSTSSVNTPATTDNPLYRRTFVGRENEVRQLQQAFDAALSGQGGLVMVVGEPGIGKTALCEQLATYVALRGGKALVGHCYEEGSLSLPYLAFVEAMRTYVLAREPDGLRSDLGTGAADVARIVSEVSDRVQGVELRAAGDPEDDRWRLLQAITSFLRNASTVQPLCIVLEDLHWADRGTLDLLLHVSRNLQGARLILIGTYRDVEVDRSHPLSGTLAEMSRAASFQRVRLRGLTVDEVHRMYETLRGNTVPWEQAEQVHRQTEGNPLFVQEVLRYLVEEGFVVREDGRWVPTQGVGAGIPEGLRDVVGKRLSRLSVECNRVLSVAAVVGRDFDLAILRTVAGLAEDDLLTAIEDAVRVGVLEERAIPGAVRYRFAHAFFRQSLYEEMIAPRRLRLHQEVARALEAQYASRREEHAAELAEHYGQSTDRADLAKAVEYSELAATRAMAVFAYAEAESHLTKCLQVQDVLDPDDRRRRCELLLALGDAILPQAEPSRIVETAAAEAFALAEAVTDRSLMARAAILCCEGLFRDEVNIATRREEYIDWAAKSDEYAAPDSGQRVLADVYNGYAYIGRGQPAAAHVYLRRAPELAAALNDPSLFFFASGWAFRNLQAIRDAELVEQLAREIVSRRREGARGLDLGVCLHFAAMTFLRNGDRGSAEAFWAELAGLAERTRDTTLGRYSAENELTTLCLDGKLEEAIAFNETLGGRVTPAYSLSIDRVLEYLGQPLRSDMADFEGPVRPVAAARGHFLARLGRHEEARGIYELFKGVESPEDETSLSIIFSLYESALLRRDHSALTALQARLAPFDHTLTFRFGFPIGVSMGRLLGEGCVVLEDPEGARSFFAAALQVSERVHFRSEIALLRLDLAELLLAHYSDEHHAAIEHLDLAIGEFQAMKMQPALERALRHRGLLKA